MWQELGIFAAGWMVSDVWHNVVLPRITRGEKR